MQAQARLMVLVFRAWLPAIPLISIGPDLMDSGIDVAHSALVLHLCSPFHAKLAQIHSYLVVSLLQFRFILRGGSAAVFAGVAPFVRLSERHAYLAPATHHRPVLCALACCPPTPSGRCSCLRLRLTNLSNLREC